MDGLRAALYPLPDEAIPVLAVAFREATAAAFPDRLRQLLREARIPSAADLSAGDALHIYEKLLYLQTPLLPLPLAAPSVLLCHVGSSCSVCGAALQAQPSAVGKLLTFSGGLVDASYQKAACVRCGREVLDCMDIAADLGLLLRCDPAAVDIFPILAPRHNDDGRSLLFVETRLLRFMSLAVVHWRASFDGFGRIWAALHAQRLSSVVRKHLFHAWLFGFRVYSNGFAKSTTPLAWLVRWRLFWPCVFVGMRTAFMLSLNTFILQQRPRVLEQRLVRFGCCHIQLRHSLRQHSAASSRHSSLEAAHTHVAALGGIARRIARHDSIGSA